METSKARREWVCQMVLVSWCNILSLCLSKSSSTPCIIPISQNFHFLCVLFFCGRSFSQIWLMWMMGGSEELIGSSMPMDTACQRIGFSAFLLGPSCQCLRVFFWGAICSREILFLLSEAIWLSGRSGTGLPCECTFNVLSNALYLSSLLLRFSCCRLHPGRGKDICHTAPYPNFLPVLRISEPSWSSMAKTGLFYWWLHPHT